MEAAALAVPQALGTVKQHVSEFLKDDPILRIGGALLRFGTAICAIGIIMTLSAPSFSKAALNERNDAEDVVGLPRTPPPGAAAPPAPPPPYYASDLATIVTSIGSLNTPEANLAGAACVTGANAAFDLVNQASMTGGPPNVSQTAGRLAETFILLSTKLGYPIPPGGESKYPYPLSSFDAKEVDWGSVPILAWECCIFANGLASELNLPSPFNIGDPNNPSPTPPPNPNLFGLSWIGTIITVGYSVLLAPGILAAEGAQALYPAAKTIYNDAAAVAGDVAKGLQVIAASIVNFPRLLADGVGFVVNWSLGQLFGWLGPILAWVGFGMALAGGILLFVYQRVWPKAQSRLELYAEARSARFWNWLDDLLGTRAKTVQVWTEKSTEAGIAAAAATPVYVQSTTPLPSPPVLLPGPKGRARHLKPEEVEAETPPTSDAGQAAVQPEAKGGSGSTSPATTPPPDLPPAPGKAETVTEPSQKSTESPPAATEGPMTPPTPEKPAEPPAGVPTREEMEAHLGSVPNRAPSPEELREMAVQAEEERRKTRVPEKTDEPTKKDLLAMAGSKEEYETHQQARKTVRPIGGRRYKASPEEIRAMASVSSTPEHKAELEEAARQQEELDRAKYTDKQHRRTYRGFMDGVNIDREATA